jgi:hypothetical protein
MIRNKKIIKVLEFGNNQYLIAAFMINIFFLNDLNTFEHKAILKHMLHGTIMFLFNS